MAAVHVSGQLRSSQSLRGQLSLSHNLQFARSISFVHRSKLVSAASHPVSSNSCNQTRTIMYCSILREGNNNMSRPKSMAQRTNADDTPDAKNQRKLYSKAKTHTHTWYWSGVVTSTHLKNNCTSYLIPNILLQSKLVVFNANILLTSDLQNVPLLAAILRIQPLDMVALKMFFHTLKVL